MTSEAAKKKAQSIVLGAYPNAKDLRVSLFEELVPGVVALVEYEDNGARKDFVHFGRFDKVVYTRGVEAFLKSLGSVNQSHRMEIVYGIAGLIAVLMVGTICYLAVTSQKIPEVLSSAITLILGFYFGTKTVPAKQ